MFSYPIESNAVWTQLEVQAPFSTMRFQKTVPGVITTPGAVTRNTLLLIFISLFVANFVNKLKKNEQYGVPTSKLSIKFAGNVIYSTVDILPSTLDQNPDSIISRNSFTLEFYK